MTNAHIDSVRRAPFESASGKLGFGCMRLPVNDDKTVDLRTFSQMVDAFLDGGLNYFDTARPYHSGNSEPAVAAALAARHDRSEFLLADKLSPGNFERREDIRPLIEDQLRACCVDYLDYYLMHSQGPSNYDKYQRCGAYDEALAARDAGLVRHVGFSFHSDAAFLDRILTDHGVRPAAGQLPGLGERRDPEPRLLRGGRGPRQARHRDGARQGRHAREPAGRGARGAGRRGRRLAGELCAALCGEPAGRRDGALRHGHARDGRGERADLLAARAALGRGASRCGARGADPARAGRSGVHRVPLLR